MKARPTLLVGVILLAGTALPCLTVGPDGVPISTASESALIVWDSKSRVEHFIREAQFLTEAKNIGFLVPTPSVPTLHVANPAVFRELGKIVSEHQARNVEGAKSAAAGSLEMRTGGVTVLSQQSVGGYDATILAAKDHEALAKWLKDNGYPSTSRTADWLKPYVEKGFTITAFKVAATDEWAGLKPVRMTFTTDTPFYPYREPAGGDPYPNRSLRVFLLTDGPMSAKHGAEPWDVKEEYAGGVSKAEEDSVKPLLEGVTLPSTLHLISYLDTSSPRDGSADLTFVPNDTRVATVGLLAGATVLWAVVLGNRRRLQRQAASEPEKS